MSWHDAPSCVGFFFCMDKLVQFWNNYYLGDCLDRNKDERVTPLRAYQLPSTVAGTPASDPKVRWFRSHLGEPFFTSISFFVLIQGSRPTQVVFISPVVKSNPRAFSVEFWWKWTATLHVSPVDCQHQQTKFISSDLWPCIDLIPYNAKSQNHHELRRIKYEFPCTHLQFTSMASELNNKHHNLDSLPYQVMVFDQHFWKQHVRFHSAYILWSAWSNICAYNIRNISALQSLSLLYRPKMCTFAVHNSSINACATCMRCVNSENTVC